MTRMASTGCAIFAVAMVLLTSDAGAVSVAGERAPSIRAPHCSLKGSTTIAANRHVRVFRTKTGLGEVYGCRRRANRAYVLGVFDECQNADEIDDAVVAGNRVALNVRTCSLDSQSSLVCLVNLRSGRVEYSSVPLSTPPPTQNQYDAIREMVVTATGRLAWHAVRVAGGAVVATEVRRRKHGSSTRAVLLDTGTDIWSLRRRGNRAFWRADGASVARSARL